jgi:hypothetical protein
MDSSASWLQDALVVDVLRRATATDKTKSAGLNRWQGFVRKGVRVTIDPVQMTVEAKSLPHAFGCNGGWTAKVKRVNVKIKHNT